MAMVSIFSGNREDRHGPTSTDGTTKNAFNSSDISLKLATKSTNTIAVNNIHRNGDYSRGDGDGDGDNDVDVPLQLLGLDLQRAGDANNTNNIDDGAHTKTPSHTSSSHAHDHEKEYAYCEQDSLEDLKRKLLLANAACSKTKFEALRALKQVQALKLQQRKQQQPKTKQEAAYKKESYRKLKEKSKLIQQLEEDLCECSGVVDRLAQDKRKQQHTISLLQGRLRKCLCGAALSGSGHGIGTLSQSLSCSSQSIGPGIGVTGMGNLRMNPNSNSYGPFGPAASAFSALSGLLNRSTPNMYAQNDDDEDDEDEYDDEVKDDEDEYDGEDDEDNSMPVYRTRVSSPTVLQRSRLEVTSGSGSTQSLNANTDDVYVHASTPLTRSRSETPISSEKTISSSRKQILFRESHTTESTGTSSPSEEGNPPSAAAASEQHSASEPRDALEQHSASLERAASAEHDGAAYGQHSSSSERDASVDHDDAAPEQHDATTHAPTALAHAHARQDHPIGSYLSSVGAQQDGGNRQQGKRNEREQQRRRSKMVGAPSVETLLVPLKSDASLFDSERDDVVARNVIKASRAAKRRTSASSSSPPSPPGPVNDDPVSISVRPHNNKKHPHNKSARQLRSRAPVLEPTQEELIHSGEPHAPPKIRSGDRDPSTTSITTSITDSYAGVAGAPTAAHSRRRSSCNLAGGSNHGSGKQICMTLPVPKIMCRKAAAAAAAASTSTLNSNNDTSNKSINSNTTGIHNNSRISLEEGKKGRGRLFLTLPVRDTLIPNNVKRSYWGSKVFGGGGPSAQPN
jgi:hypothetical protein